MSGARRRDIYSDNTKTRISGETLRNQSYNRFHQTQTHQNADNARIHNKSDINKQIKKRYHLRVFGYKISLFSLILLVFLFSILYNVIHGLYGLTVNYNHLAESRRTLEEKSRMKEALQAKQELWQTDEVLEEEARKLGMVKEGETLYIEIEPLKEE